LFALRASYSVAHGWAARLVESTKFTFFKLKPERVYVPVVPELPSFP
jgi:hypothetical protein